jgi:hypothetical protein
MLRLQRLLAHMQVEELDSDMFAFNMRMMETKAHRKFHDYHVRLWSCIGAGSYFISDKSLEYLEYKAGWHLTMLPKSSAACFRQYVCMRSCPILHS